MRSIASAGAPQSSPVLLSLKTLLCDIAVNARIFGGPIEQPKQERKNQDSNCYQAQPEHGSLLSCLKKAPLDALALLVSGEKVNWQGFRRVLILRFPTV